MPAVNAASEPRRRAQHTEAPTPQEQEPTPGQIVGRAAREACEVAKSREQACDLLERQVKAGIAAALAEIPMATRKHLELPLGMLLPYLPVAVQTAIGKVYRQERSTAWNAKPSVQKPAVVASTTTGPSADVRRMMALSAGNLLMMPLSTGKLLKDARKEDLLGESSFYNKQATDMAHKARFYSAIAEKIGRKVVGSVFTDEALRALQDEVK